MALNPFQYSLFTFAIDNAGNRTTKTATYTVAYQFGSFASPLAGNGVMNVAKAGQTIPLKWRLVDASGSPIITLQSASVSVVQVLVPLFMFIRYLITLHVDYFPAYEIALAIVATSLIFRYVDPDRPARMVVRTALTDWRHTREPSSELRDARLIGSKVRIRPELTGDLV